MQIPLLFDTTDFPPRWHCGVWSDLHGWVHIVSDLLIWSAYMAIPCALLYFVRRRSDAPFPKIFWLFGLFIFACGTGHLIEAIIFWSPIYRIAGLLKVITAVASWATVIVLIPLIPRALGFPTLDRVNRELEAEIKERREVESKLRTANSELSGFHDVAVGREHQMIALKSEVNELRKRLGEEPAYDTAFSHEELERDS